MYRLILAAGAALLSLPAAAVASEDCTKEVFAAVEKQSKQKGFRMETDVISGEGPLKVTMEYILPGRMRQVAVLAVDPKPVETILVEGQAWTNEGGPNFIPMTFQHTEQLIEQMRKATRADPDAVGKFECMGLEKIDGKDVRVYKSKPMLPSMKTPDGKEVETTAKNEAVRLVYVDAESGLPVKTVLTKEGALDKSLFKEVYSYPPDLKIDPPAKESIEPR
jgi:hypothetical protein